MLLNHYPKIAALLLSSVLFACVSDIEKRDDDNKDVYLQLGVRYLSMNKLEIAKENLEHALDDDSNNVQAHNALGFLYEKIGKPDEAKDHYQTALNLAPNDLSVQNNFGRFLCEHKQFAQGMALLDQAGMNQLNDHQWLALTNAGRCQLAMQQVAKAEAYFRQALLTNDSYAPALAEMQKLSFQKRDYWAAKGYMQRYIAVAEQNAETLWFAEQTERALGNIELAKDYHRLLTEKFPLSNEAKQSNSVAH